MSAELVAIGFQIALSTVFALLFILFYKKEKKEIIESFNIEQIESRFTQIIDERFNIELLKIEFTDIVDERLQEALDTVGESIKELLTDPTVSKAFSIIGSQGGQAKALNSAADEMAMDMIEGPQFAAIRMGAEAMGLDIEGYISKHGAIKTLQAAQQLAKLAGVDIMKLDIGSLAAPGASVSTGNPYLRR